MALYTFYCRRADGAPVTLETREAVSDQAALAEAAVIKDRHASCDHVEVCDGERVVGYFPAND